jgi:HK97 gp10 family phage protein
MAVFITPVNLPEVQAKLKALDLRVQTHVRRSILKAMADEVMQGAKAKAPKGATGNLQKSIAAKVYANHAEVGVQKKAFYAHFVEFGTGSRTVKSYRGHKGVKVNVGSAPAQPFMRPAAESPTVHAAGRAEGIKQMGLFR